MAVHQNTLINLRCSLSLIPLPFTAIRTLDILFRHITLHISASELWSRPRCSDARRWEIIHLDTLHSLPGGPPEAASRKDHVNSSAVAPTKASPGLG